MGSDQRSNLTVRASKTLPPSQTLREHLQGAVSSMTLRNVDEILKNKCNLIINLLNNSKDREETAV